MYAQQCLMLLLYLTVFAAAANSKINAKKASIIQKKVPVTAAAIRELSTSSQQAKLQLVNMAADLVIDLNVGTHLLNFAIPNIIEENGYTDVLSITEVLAETASDLQKAIPGNPERLQQKIASLLEGIDGEVSQLQSRLRTDNALLNEQLTRVYGLITFATYRLKYQASLFENPNEDLDAEINNAIAKLSDAISSLSSPDQLSESEVRGLLQHLSYITAKNVYRLDNWVDVNRDIANDVRLVQEVSKTLSDLYTRLNRIASGNNNVSYLLSQLNNIVKVGTRQVAKLAYLKYPENLGGTELIRSSLIDAIAVGRTYGENIKTLVS